MPKPTRFEGPNDGLPDQYRFGGGIGKDTTTLPEDLAHPGLADNEISLDSNTINDFEAWAEMAWRIWGPFSAGAHFGVGKTWGQSFTSDIYFCPELEFSRSGGTDDCSNGSYLDVNYDRWKYSGALFLELNVAPGLAVSGSFGAQHYDFVGNPNQDAKGVASTIFDPAYGGDGNTVLVDGTQSTWSARLLVEPLRLFGVTDPAWKWAQPLGLYGMYQHTAFGSETHVISPNQYDALPVSDNVIPSNKYDIEFGNFHVGLAFTVTPEFQQTRRNQSIFENPILHGRASRTETAPQPENESAVARPESMDAIDASATEIKQVEAILTNINDSILQLRLRRHRKMELDQGDNSAAKIVLNDARTDFVPSLAVIYVQFKHDNVIFPATGTLIEKAQALKAAMLAEVAYWDSEDQKARAANGHTPEQLQTAILDSLQIPSGQEISNKEGLKTAIAEYEDGTVKYGNDDYDRADNIVNQLAIAVASVEIGSNDNQQVLLRMLKNVYGLLGAAPTEIYRLEYDTLRTALNQRIMRLEAIATEQPNPTSPPRETPRPDPVNPTPASATSEKSSAKFVLQLNGRPAVGVKVEISYRVGLLSWSRETYNSNGNGEVLIENLPVDKEVKCVVTDSQYNRSKASVFVKESTTSETIIEIEAKETNARSTGTALGSPPEESKPKADFTIRMTDNEGKAVSNLEVQILYKNGRERRRETRNTSQQAAHSLLFSNKDVGTVVVITINDSRFKRVKREFTIDTSSEANLFDLQLEPKHAANATRAEAVTSPPQATENKADAVFTIKDNRGQALSGVKVALYYTGAPDGVEKRRTGNNGHINLKNFDVGTTVVLVVQDERYIMATIQLEVTADGDASAVLNVTSKTDEQPPALPEIDDQIALPEEVEPTGTIEIHVTDQTTRAPVQGAYIEIMDDALESNTFSSNATGLIVAADIDAQDFRALVLKAVGYEDLRITDFELEAGETETFDLQLKPIAVVQDSAPAVPQIGSVKIKVVAAGSNTPLAGVKVQLDLNNDIIEDTGEWAITNALGEVVIKNVPTDFSGIPFLMLDGYRQLSTQPVQGIQANKTNEFTVSLNRITQPATPAAPTSPATPSSSSVESVLKNIEDACFDSNNKLYSLSESDELINQVRNYLQATTDADKKKFAEAIGKIIGSDEYTDRQTSEFARALSALRIDRASTPLGIELTHLGDLKNAGKYKTPKPETSAATVATPAAITTEAQAIAKAKEVLATSRRTEEDVRGAIEHPLMSTKAKHDVALEYLKSHTSGEYGVRKYLITYLSAAEVKQYAPELVPAEPPQPTATVIAPTPVATTPSAATHMSAEAFRTTVLSKNPPEGLKTILNSEDAFMMLTEAFAFAAEDPDLLTINYQGLMLETNLIGFLNRIKESNMSAYDKALSYDALRKSLPNDSIFKPFIYATTFYAIMHQISAFNKDEGTHVAKTKYLNAAYAVFSDEVIRARLPKSDLEALRKLLITKTQDSTEWHTTINSDYEKCLASYGRSNVGLSDSTPNYSLIAAQKDRAERATAIEKGRSDYISAMAEIFNYIRMKEISSKLGLDANAIESLSGRIEPYYIFTINAEGKVVGVKYGPNSTPKNLPKIPNDGATNVQIYLESKNLTLPKFTDPRFSEFNGGKATYDAGPYAPPAVIKQ